MERPVDLVARKIAACRRIAITDHLRPDGDSLCTSLGLAEAAEAIGLTADIVNTDRTPYPFQNFPSLGRVRIGQIPAGVYDAVVLLECADVSRSGQRNLDGYFKINIDHHYSNARYADINWVDPEASAVGEMALTLCEALGVRLSPGIAAHLYCAIVSDTGSFQFSNTTARAFAACHTLVAAGANPTATSEALFHNHRPEKVRLLGQVLSTLTVNAKRDIAIIRMFREDLRAFETGEVDTEDITTVVRSIKGIAVVLFFKEVEPGVFRVSIRSKGSAHAAAIAERFGGGGHAHAAGFTVTGPFERLIVDVPAAVERILEENGWRVPSPPA
jgi:phosphoesterase RecJ-like protein